MWGLWNCRASLALALAAPYIARIGVSFLSPSIFPHNFVLLYNG